VKVIVKILLFILDIPSKGILIQEPNTPAVKPIPNFLKKSAVGSCKK
jgi:hypothetical protein